MSALTQDFSFAVRTLRKSPGFAFTAILTIALGIGASTAIFSVVNGVLLRPLPYAEPKRLVLLQNDLAARKVYDFPMAPGDLPDVRNWLTLLEDIAAVVTNRQAMNNDAGEPELITTAAVTPNFFRTLGARVVRGRDFVEEDALAPAAPPPGVNAGAAPSAAAPPPPPTLAIISDGMWRRRFGADPQIVGKQVRVGQQTVDIVGVLEPGFELLWPAASNIAAHPDIYSALRIDFSTASRVNVFLRVVARLKPGATIPQVQSQVDGVIRELKQRFPIKETAGLRMRVEPMHQYVVADVKPALVALMGAVGFVLLIACANVANLLLVRASQRERDLAVRAALGSSRWALVRQMLVESIVISGAGAVIGVGLAWVGVRALVTIGPENLIRLGKVALDPEVMVFSATAAALAALLFGVVPALRASRVDVGATLRATGRSGALSNSGRWLRNGVVVSEVALAFVLLVGSGLMIRSFITVQRANPGFDPSGIVMLQLPNGFRESPDEQRALTQQLHERLSGIPSVTAVSAASSLPLENFQPNARWGTEAALTDPSKFQQADLRIVLPNYFEVMRTSIVDGRAFTSADAAPDLRLAIIDEVFANKAFPGEKAVGKRFLARTGGPDPLWYEVIGVVRHQRSVSLAADGRETMYVPDGSIGPANRWILRSSGDLARVAQAANAEVRQLDRTLVVSDLQPMTVLVDKATAPTRFALVCIGVFAVIAGILASVGLYGVLATSVRQRTAEIGVRMAFGATPRNVFGLVVRQGLALSAIGIVAGVASAFALTRYMSTMVVGVGTSDPSTYAVMAMVFLAVAVLACWVPARRAAALDPLEALREE